MKFAYDGFGGGVNLKIHTYPLGPVQTNCYIIEHENKTCLIVDPGEEGQRLIDELTRLHLQPIAILLTHAHFDHIGAVDILRDHYHIPLYVHENEQDWLEDPTLNGSAKYVQLPDVSNRKPEHTIHQEGPMQLGSFTFDVRHTPGHSPGSISFVFENEEFAIVGDTLFREGIGRTDLVGGDTALLLQSIHSKLLSLDDDVTIFPGHGPATTPAQEKEMNPFLHGF